jgi:hypothetical protein
LARGRHGGTTRSRKRPRDAGIAPTRSWTIRRLADDLAADGDAVKMDPATGHLLIERWTGQAAAELMLDDAQLQDHLRTLANGAASVWPDRHPMDAALCLLIVHLDETMATTAMPGSKLIPGYGGIDADPARPLPDVPDLPRGPDYEWRAMRPDESIDG